ncbi:MAG: cobalt-precorrin-5B (C(1))-methyltransferase CbiD [Desulfobacteraceae bacterium]|jgi:cobalt-precorrin-5B (C1)-methyltransferase|nr:cobalt-precorrin-5B (C(1))-methyltransferase CbiD [Desulfobacteraceae bacterium]
MKKKLRTGFTTGTAAAAATKGALQMILDGKKSSRVCIRLLTGDDIYIPLHCCRLEKKGHAVCTVIKDAGDDPDVTHKAEIGARVSIQFAGPNQSGGTPLEIVIGGGEGVGRVTKPGLEVPPGGPAINPGPVKMITQAIHDVLKNHRLHGTVETEIFVPQGEKIAEKTLNARLGILGGISILGTTGIVRPMSHDAFIATITSALSVARASGVKNVVLTTGRRSERFAQHLWPKLAEEAFVQIGDFFKMSLEAASRQGFEKATLAVFFGKALKMAQGVPHTHAARASLTLDKLAGWAQEITGNRQLAQHISAANTARHAFDIIGHDYPGVIGQVGKGIVKSAQRFGGPDIRIQSIIFDYTGNVVFDSDIQEIQTV